MVILPGRYNCYNFEHKYTIASKCIKYKMMEIKVDTFTIKDRVVILNKSFLMRPG